MICKKCIARIMKEDHDHVFQLTTAFVKQPLQCYFICWFNLLKHAPLYINWLLKNNYNKDALFCYNPFPSARFFCCGNAVFSPSAKYVNVSQSALLYTIWLSTELNKNKYGQCCYNNPSLPSWIRLAWHPH